MKLLLTLCACLLYCVAAAAQPDFRPLVQQALQRGEKRIVIAPGVYRLSPPAGKGTIWEVSHVRDVEIVADGVTLVGLRLARGLTFYQCRNLTLRGLTLDYDPLPFTQGTVVAVAPGREWIDVRLHEGYPRRPYSRIDVVDARTRFRKKGMPFLWGTRAEMSAPDTVRVSLPGIGAAAQVGDLASLSTGQEDGFAPHGITVEGCAGVAFERVTVHSAPGMGIIESDGDGGNRYSDCKVVLGPKPRGASEARLLTTSWDAMQSKCTKVGATVENCVIEDAGDDSWSVQSSDFLVVKREGRAVTLAFRDEWTDGPQVGDALRASLDAPEARIAERTVARRENADLAPEILAKLQAAPQYSLWDVSPKCVRLVLDREPPFDVGQSVMCPDRQGNGFVFRSNRVHSPGRVLIKAGGLVENNVLDTPHNLTVAPEVPAEAAAGIQGLTIRGNTIRESGFFCPAPWSACAGAISITAAGEAPRLRPAGVFRNIVVEGNVLEGICGPNLVISSARGVQVRGNRFVNAGQVAPRDTGASYRIALGSVIWGSECEGLQVEGNAITDTGPFVGAAIVVDGREASPKKAEK